MNYKEIVVVELLSPVSNRILRAEVKWVDSGGGTIDLVEPSAHERFIQVHDFGSSYYPRGSVRGRFKLV